MKKVVVLLLIAVMVFMMACKAPTQQPEATEPAPTEEVTETEKPEDPVTVLDPKTSPELNQKMVIANLPKMVGGAYFTRMFEGGFKEYEKLTGSETFLVGSNTADAAAQNRYVQDLVAQQVDVICAIPAAAEQMDAELKKAMDAGIIVITMEAMQTKNRHYDIEPFDAAAFGASAAECIAKGMNNEGELVLFVGGLTSTTHMAWAQGIVDVIKEKYPKITIATGDGPFLESGNNAAVSYEKAKEVLKAYPNCTAIYSGSATDTPSIARAIEEAGLSDKITLVGTGLPNAIRTYLKNGSMDYDLTWDPADLAIAMCRLASAVKSGIEIKDGMDLGAFGFNKIKLLENNVVMGTEWIIATAEDIDNYNF